MPYETVFRAPLEIARGDATLNWVKNDKGFMLDGRDIDVQATGVRARGGSAICSRRVMNPGSVSWPVSVPTTAVRHGATSRKI